MRKCYRCGYRGSNWTCPKCGTHTSDADIFLSQATYEGIRYRSPETSEQYRQNALNALPRSQYDELILGIPNRLHGAKINEDGEAV